MNLSIFSKNEVHGLMHCLNNKFSSIHICIFFQDQIFVHSYIHFPKTLSIQICIFSKSNLHAFMHFLKILGIHICIFSKNSFMHLYIVSKNIFMHSHMHFLKIEFHALIQAFKTKFKIKKTFLYAFKTKTNQKLDFQMMVS